MSKTSKKQNVQDVAKNQAIQDIAEDGLESLLDAKDTQISGLVVTQMQETATKSQAKKARRSWFPYTDLVAETAGKAGLKPSDLSKALRLFFDRSSQLLADGEVIVFAGFGSFTGRVVHARQVRVPSTGEIIQTEDRVRVKYKASSRVNTLLDTCTVSAFESQ